MRIRILTLLAAGALVVPTAAQAQSSASGDLNVNVTVIKALTLTKIVGTDLDFGTNAAGTTPAAIAHADGVQFEADGQANTSITVNHDGNISLTGGGGDPIPFTADFRGFNTNTSGSAAAVADGATVTLDATNGNYFFWLGGSLAALPANQVAGSYTAIWTLSVAY